MSEEKVRTSNYTAEMEDRLVEVYQANPSRETVEALADEMGKTPRSVIAKLASLKVYQKTARKDKVGRVALRKDQLAAVVAEATGVADVEGLAKATKESLHAVREFLETEGYLDVEDEGDEDE